ncbi:MAG TPA: terpene cyclase/mutase family protein, partial [Pirellulales bacterium]|nr:terpene cyclase/mutase family protein [Pirellulales bacterium]
MPVPANMPRPIPLPAAGNTDPMKIRLRHEQSEEDEQFEVVARNAPPWLISCLVHLALVVVLGLWYISGQRKFSGIVLDVYAEDAGEQLVDVTSLESIGEIQPDEALLTPDNLEKVEDPFAPDPSLPTVALETSEPSAIPLDKPNISLALAGREPGTKATLLGKYGGNPDTEAAVARALAWLKLQQRKDGSWSLKGPYRSGSVSGRDVPESATAMALLAFQGAGHTHLKGEYKKQVAEGRKALLKMQDSNGNFFQEGGASNHWFYAHGQCTIALCELYGMTKDPELKRPAELAIKYCIDTQEPELGGWRYMPRSDSDTSVTGWIMMALQSARMSGLDVPS